MPIDERWNALTPSDWNDFAVGWLAELRGESIDSDIGESVVAMNFTSTAEQQWQFIKALGHVVVYLRLHFKAGPLV